MDAGDGDTASPAGLRQRERLLNGPRIGDPRLERLADDLKAEEHTAAQLR
jgi:hypothetical protein